MGFGVVAMVIIRARVRLVTDDDGIIFHLSSRSFLTMTKGQGEQMMGLKELPQRIEQEPMVYLCGVA
jgi:hypothetical protein